MQRALGIEVFRASFFEPDRVNGSSPYGLIEKRTSADQASDITARVLDLLSIRCTHQIFGFTFESLMALDPFTFTKVEARVHKLAEKMQKTASDLNDSLDELDQ